MRHEICRDDSRRMFFRNIGNHPSDYVLYLKEVKVLKIIPYSSTGRQ
jgi:hypothetical protein